MKKWLFHQNGFTRTGLSATVTRVSNFVEENVCVRFLHRQASVPVDSAERFSHSRLNMSIAMHSAYSKH